MKPTLRFLAISSFLPLTLEPQGRAFTPADWYRVTNVNSPAMSPDGRLVAFTVTTVRESENRRHSEIWVAPTDGGVPRRFTSPGYESSGPRWSPDGTYLLFTSQRAGSRGRTFGIRMDQPSGEAEEIDRYPAGSLTADRKTVVWTEGTPGDSGAQGADPYSGMQGMARPPFGSITAPLDPRRFDGRHITEMRYKANGPGFLPGPRAARVYRPAQVWTQTLDGSPRRMLDSTAYSRRGAVVSPDGNWIAWIADPRLRSDSAVEAERDSIARLPYDRRRDEAPRNDADIFIVPASGGAVQRLTTANGSETDIQWSPDGRWISFQSAPTRTSNTRLYVISAGGGTPVNLLGNWQYEPDGSWWMPDGRIAMTASIGGRTGFFHVDPGLKSITEVLGGARRRASGYSVDAAGRTMAYVSTSLTRPTEIYLSATDGTRERKLTGFNDSLTTEVAFSDAERFTYRSVGNLEIEGWLMKPWGYDPSRRYPAVLYIHGGPHSAYGEGWFDEFQNLAAAGMFVIFTNPRGSSGYGAPFTYSTRGRWFAEDYQDLMRAVDIVARRPDVDSTRMGVTGGSYGGVMTAWVTVKTNRFKAAQADRMISNWWSWYGTSDAQGLTEFEFLGKPWDNPVLYDTLSPIRYIRKVRTPTLIVQSEEDHRTPMTDAEQWFIGLRKHGIPVELVRYPRSTHDLSRSGEPWLLVDRLGRLRQWFAHWLRPATPVVGDGAR
ncbi:MAG: S9 family peptidase [Gemmatimonadota bacterium]